MDYYRHTQRRAKFKKLGVDAGKATITFEVGGDELYTLPTLALLVGEKCALDISSDQQVLLLDAGTGEVIDQEPDEDQMTIDDEIEEGAEDEPEEDDDSEGEADLPPAAQEYVPDDELDAIFGTESAA